MKKIKRIGTIFACFAIAIVSAFSFVGCTKQEVKESTEAAIESATSILPVEYSKSLAQGVLANAFATSINEKAIKCDYLMESYSFAGFKADPDLSSSSIYLDENGKITEKMDMKSNGQNVMTAYAISVKQEDNSYKYYSLQNSGSSKKYCEIERNKYGGFGVQNNTSIASVYGGKMHLSGLVITSQDDGQVAVESMLDHVIGGRYFNGKTYISACFNYSDAWGSQYSEKKGFNVEYVIEDNKITSIRILLIHETYSKGTDGIANTADDVLDGKWNIVETFQYEYASYVIEDAPTSIDGYTFSEFAASSII